MNRYLPLLLMLCAVVVVWPTGTPQAASQIDVYHFDDEQQRQRYKALIDEFRCPKCTNTNLSGSDAPIAQDLRRTVHRLVVEQGYEDQAVRDFLQARYGDFVLYDPPFNARTWLIWVFPLVILVIGAFVLFRLKSGAVSQSALSADQRAQVQAILESDQDRA